MYFRCSLDVLLMQFRCSFKVDLRQFLLHIVQNHSMVTIIMLKLPQSKTKLPHWLIKTALQTASND